jgi:hypothetical protein
MKTSAELARAIGELESQMREACNLAMAIRMMASSDDMPEEPGLALDSVADMLVGKLEAMEKERERIWHVARGDEEAAGDAA